MIPTKTEVGGVSEKNYRPKFKETPSNRDAIEGTMTRFDCVLSGRPIPELLWFRNDEKVNSGSDRVIQ